MPELLRTAETVRRGRPGLVDHLPLVELVSAKLTEKPEIAGAAMHQHVKRHPKAWPGSAAPSENAVRKLLKQLRSAKPFEARDWVAWESKRETPEDVALIRRLGLIASLVRGQPIQQHEAEHARRLRPSLEGLDPVVQWVVVWEYALREEREAALGSLGRPGAASQAGNTEDLDTLLALRPWAEEGTSYLYQRMQERDVAQQVGLSHQPCWESAGLDFRQFLGWVLRSLEGPASGMAFRNYVRSRYEGPGFLPLEGPTDPDRYNWVSVLSQAVRHRGVRPSEMETEVEV